MTRIKPGFQDLGDDDFVKIKRLASRKEFKKDSPIFSEGDAADHVYFIESGQVSIFVQKFTSREEIGVLGPGEYFGEMAVFNTKKRTASVAAVTDTCLLCVTKDAFLDLVKTDRTIAEKINKILARRNEELVLMEKLLETTGVKSKNLRVSIKGDPSLRESAFSRERYESVVDKVLPQLAPRLEDLLLNRSVYEIFMHFNSGEVNVASIFDPFNDEIHPASKLVDEAYIDRHFPLITYERKTSMIKRLYNSIAGDPCFSDLPGHLRRLFGDHYASWQPVSAMEISNTLSRLPMLRTIPNFYLRNFTISLAHDGIRMQFNCDGTHIVSAEDYPRFLEENIVAE